MRGMNIEGRRTHIAPSTPKSSLAAGILSQKSVFFEMLGFKKAGGSDGYVASSEGVARLQSFLDEVAHLGLSDAQREWYQVEVATMLDGSEILMHEVNR
jgi:hypothetical protein